MFILLTLVHFWVLKAKKTQNSVSRSVSVVHLFEIPIPLSQSIVQSITMDIQLSRNLCLTCEGTYIFKVIHPPFERLLI